MVGHLKLSGLSRLSSPFAFRRSTTTTSATDSSTASSSDGTSPGHTRQPPRRMRQRENQRRVHNDRSITTSRNRTTRSDCDITNINSNTDSNRRRRSSSVSFGEVTIREYNRSLGDWWDIQNGLGLGWEYHEHSAIPLPDEDEQEAKNYAAKLRKNQVKKLKAKMRAWLLVSHNKRNSMGVIQAESLRDFHSSDNKNIKVKNKNSHCNSNSNSNSKPKKGKMPAYEDTKPSSKIRKEVLKEFGFTSSELNSSEAERKLLHLEYKNLTQRGPSINRQHPKPSELLTARFSADISESVPDTGTVTYTTTDTATSADATSTTTATTTVTITPTTVTTKTTAVTTIGGTSTTTTTEQQHHQ